MMLRFGTTEGRFRMIVPDLITEFRDTCPSADLRVSMASADVLREQLLDGSALLPWHVFGQPSENQ